MALDRAPIAPKPGPVIEPSHPFIAAKPPTSDHLTYLTLLEFNLTNENVAVLRHVLQEDLTAGGSLFNDIGWDLVGLLLPFVTAVAAKETLLDVAILGNPRECALKVEQGLRAIDWEADDDENEDNKDDEDEDQADVHPALRVPKDDQGPSGLATEGSKAEDHNANKANKSLPLLQFKTLVNMLAMLHPRISTKQPSRFIATTLSAVLAAMAGASPQHHQACVDAAVKLVRTLNESQAFEPPPRTATTDQPGARTEQVLISEERAPLDAKIQQRLLQSFVTHVVELWMRSLDGTLDEDTINVPALAWATRFQEQEQPRMVVPDRPTMQQQFEQSHALRSRDDRSARLFALARGLGLSSQELMDAASKATISELEAKAAHDGTGEAEEKDDDDPPEKPEDVPLSQVGCLFLVAYEQFTIRTKADARSSMSTEQTDAIQIFPQVVNLVRSLVGSPEDVMISTASFSEALLDAILFLALLALSQNSVGDPDEAFSVDKDAFPRFLQVTSLLSANVPNASLRYCAHVVTATILRSHPDPIVRFNFIRDTLENAPVDLLKAEAVGWLKGEVIEANFAPGAAEGEHSIFKTSMALDSLSMYLYPDLQSLVPTILNSASAETTPVPTQVFTEAVKPRLPFFLTVLNFHFLLLSMPSEVRERLDILSLHSEADVATGFLSPLREVARKSNEALGNGAETSRDEALQEMKSDIMILQQAIEKVEGRLVAVAKEGR